MAFDSTTAKKAGTKSSRSGVPNKTTSEIRETFQMLIQSNLPKMQEWLDQVGQDQPKEALMIITRLAEFLLPKLSRAEVLLEGDPEPELDYTKLSTSALEEIERIGQEQREINKNH